MANMAYDDVDEIEVSLNNAVSIQCFYKENDYNYKMNKFIFKTLRKDIKRLNILIAMLGFNDTININIKDFNTIGKYR